MHTRSKKSVRSLGIQRGDYYGSTYKELLMPAIGRERTVKTSEWPSLPEPAPPRWALRELKDLGLDIGRALSSCIRSALERFKYTVSLLLPIANQPPEVLRNYVEDGSMLEDPIVGQYRNREEFVNDFLER